LGEERGGRKKVWGKGLDLVFLMVGMAGYIFGVSSYCRYDTYNMCCKHTKLPSGAFSGPAMDNVLKMNGIFYNLGRGKPPCLSGTGLGNAAFRPESGQIRNPAGVDFSASAGLDGLT
jgi:hypothetical protein